MQPHAIITPLKAIRMLLDGTGVLVRAGGMIWAAAVAMPSAITADGEGRGMPEHGLSPGSTRLTGSDFLSDAPLTKEDWRVIWHAYYGFITIARKVARDAYARQDAETPLIDDDIAPEPDWWKDA